MIKRIFLWIAMNLAIIAVVEVIFSILKIDPSIANNMNDFDYQSVLVISLVYGFVGSFISLLLSKFMAKKMCGVNVIEHPRNETESWLVSTIEHYASVARIPVPEIGIYHGTPNAFATGYSKNNSLLAVSDGLLGLMDKKEAEAVICHELSHIKNGDMVTMSLLQGVLNAFIIFFSRLLAHIITSAGKGRNKRESSHALYYFISMILRIVLGILSSLVLMAYSRKREYAADKGSSDIMGEPMSMISALNKLGTLTGKSSLPKEMAAFGVAGDNSMSFAELFASHPTIAKRISALKKNY